MDISTGKKTEDNIREEEKSLCERRLSNDIALVEIHFSTPFVTQMKQDVRVSFADKISNIGNYSNLKNLVSYVMYIRFSLVT